MRGGPGHDGAGFVLALEDHGRVEGGGGCIGSQSGRPDELHCSLATTLSNPIAIEPPTTLGAVR